MIDAGSASVIGSMLNAGKGMQISTDIGDIKVLAAKETERNYAKEETMKVGFGEVFKSLTKPGELIQTSGGQLTVKLSEASYDKVDFESTAVEQKASELRAGENLSFSSVADILLEGAAVKAKGDVNLIADGNVTIKEAETTYSETKAEVYGKADLSLVVQHQAVEVVKAAEAVDQAKDQVKQAQADYRKYQKERDQLQETLAKLEADYQNKVPGVSYNDILELRTLLDDIKGDEAWYQAGIATASANLASQSTLLLQQTSAAAQSAATYGFNAGLQLNIAATKTDSHLDSTGSLASSISGNNINILTGGDGQKGTTLIQGSHLAATDGLNIYTGELNVLASQDTMRSETDTKSGTMTIAQTVWGAAGGPTVNGSFNSAQQQDKQTTHTNSSLTADRLNLVTTGDANIIGGHLQGASLVNLNVGGDLTLESVQDRLSGSSKGFGVSGGTSFGGVFTNENGAGANSKEAKTTAVGATDGLSGVNGGVNASNSRYQSTETLLSSITGGTVSIDVNGHTQLNGALIAALDAQGKDNGNLSLTTGSFAFTDLSNKSYRSSQSFGVSANLGLSDKANAADPAQSSTESTLNSSTYSYQNQSNTSVDKTLATVGHGNLTIGGVQGSPDGLNRDAQAIHKELYRIDRTQGNMDLTVDHRLLSEDGRKAIVEDAKRTEILGKAIADLAEQSVSLTGSGDGESSVRDHIGTTQDYFTATKNFTQSPENKEHVATLESPNATPEQKQAAYTALANAIATYMGVDPTQAKVLMASDPQFAGAYSRDTGTIYVNDAAHDTATAAVTTVGHETQHYLDNQQNPNAVQSPQYQSNREKYADIMGNATADYLNFNFAQNNYALAGSNTHSVGSSYQEALANMSLLSGNQHLYGSENQANIDNRFLRTEEFQLAERLASESNGKFTTQQILDTLRHANTGGDNAWVVDTALASAATLHNMDGTEGRLIVTQDEHGQARYIVQNMSQIPLNEDAKAYIQQQGLGYSFTEQYQSQATQSGFGYDLFSGKPLDETGRYSVGYMVEDNIFSVPHFACGTAECVAQKQNIDWSAPSAQAYHTALSAKALDDTSTIATGVLLFTPPGALATGLGLTGTTVGLGASYLDGEFVKGVGKDISSKIFEAAFSDMFGNSIGGKINTAFDLLGVHEQNVIFIPKDKVVFDIQKDVSDEND